MDNKIFIDIECVPSDTMPNIEDIKAPANYKDEAKIKAWREENQLEVYKKQALDSMHGRIICIGVGVFGDIDDTNINVFAEKDELTSLKSFNEWLQDRRNTMQENPHFVGWNISTFDIPWLWRKAIQYNLSGLRKIIPKDDRNCYTDLMRVWASDYKDYCSQANVARFLGIPEEEGGFSGADVYDAWKAGEIEKIAGHCGIDIQIAMDIYGRIYA